MLHVEHIHKTFFAGTINEKVALQDLSLHLAPGDFVTVIGGNGAGKSTLLNSIAGVFPIDSGKIVIDGVDIEENLAIAARRGKTPGLKWSLNEKDHDWFVEMLKELDLGLENRMTAKVGLLSGGQRQALTLLMATIKRPKLLLLDEHTAALDPKTAAKVLSLTERIIDRDKLTALMITHNMRDALKYGNRLIMMYNGRILVDVAGEEKKNLTTQDLLLMFEKAAGNTLDSDRLLLG